MRFKLFSILLAIFIANPAFADVWGYVDANGVSHFSAKKLDERYELFFRGDSFSASKGQKPAASLRQPPAATVSARAPATTPVPSKLLTYFDISPAYKAVKHLLKDAAATHGMDYELLQALIATESGFNPKAISPKGAVGLMQLMPPTASRYGVRGDRLMPVEEKLFDAKTNIAAGSSYLRDLLKMFPGQIELALAAYNAGEGAVQRAGNKIPNYPETQNYVKTVMQLYAHLKPPSAGRTDFAQSDHLSLPGRVRMEMMGGRSNLVSTAAGAGTDAAEGASGFVLDGQPPFDVLPGAFEPRK